MKFKNLLLLLLLLTTSVLAGQDYYKLLGLKRDATDD
jgi:DnaJ-class molecular chaperone